MDISSEPSDVTMRTASDNTVVSAPDVTMQSAVADITRQVDAIPTGGVSINGAEEVNEELFAPVQIAPFAKSCDGFTHGETTLGLPHRVYSEWNSQPYDNAWMEKAGVSEDKLDEFVSKVKMENLVLKSALKIGDELYTVVKDAEGVITAEKMARVSLRLPKLQSLSTLPSRRLTIDLSDRSWPLRSKDPAANSRT